MFVLTFLTFRIEGDCDVVSKMVFVIIFPFESCSIYDDLITKLNYIDFNDNYIDHLVLPIFTLVVRVVR